MAKPERVWRYEIDWFPDPRRESSLKISALMRDL
jgi:hypothetical protein